MWSPYPYARESAMWVLLLRIDQEHLAGTWVFVRPIPALIPTSAMTVPLLTIVIHDVDPPSVGILEVLL